MNELIMVALGAGGGILIKLIDFFLISRKDKGAENIGLMNTLQNSVNALTKKVDLLQKEIDDWKEKYYKLLKENASLTQKYITLKGELARLKEKYSQQNKQQ